MGEEVGAEGESQKELAEIQEWSATHYRLRAELVVTAVVIAAFTWYGIDLSESALFGIKLDRTVPIPHLIIEGGLYGFFLYTLLALAFRTRVENLRSSDPSALFGAFMVRLEQQSRAAMDMASPQLSGFSPVQANLETLDREIRTARANYVSHAAREIAEFHRRETPFRPVAPPLSPDMVVGYETWLVQHGLSVEAAEPLVPMLHELMQEKDLIAEELERLKDDFMSGALKSRLAQIDAAIENLAASVKDSADFVMQRGSYFTENLQKSHEALRREVRALRQEIVGARNAVGFERNLISLWFPVLFSVLIAFSRPAAWVLSTVIGWP